MAIDKVQKANADFYNKHAIDWTSQKSDSFYAEKQFRQFVSLFKRGSAVIDIGCANGNAVPLFVGIGSKLKYEGVDISSALLKIAKSRYPNFNFYKSNILDRSTLPKKRYDGFWAAAILQHIPDSDWSVMLSNIEKITKKGGIGYISLPENRLSTLSEIDPRHFNLFTKNKFRSTVSSRQWKIVKSGILPAMRRSTIWRWFIVKLP